jgi:hypothetical protein
MSVVDQTHYLDSSSEVMAIFSIYGGSMATASKVYVLERLEMSERGGQWEFADRIAVEQIGNKSRGRKIAAEIVRGRGFKKQGGTWRLRAQ